jgi:hypothetical protein
MTDRELQEQVDVMARWVLRAAFEAWAEDHGWEDVPEIGEYDYDRIMVHALTLLKDDVDMGEYSRAYEFFKERAQS